MVTECRRKLLYIAGHGKECKKKLLYIIGYDSECGNFYTLLVMIQKTEVIMHCWSWYGMQKEALIYHWSWCRIWKLLSIVGHDGECGCYYTSLVECKLIQLQKTVDRFFKVLKGHLTCISAILLLSTYPRKYERPAVLCLLWARHNAKTANQLSCPSVDK